MRDKRYPCGVLCLVSELTYDSPYRSTGRLILVAGMPFESNTGSLLSREHWPLMQDLAFWA